MNGYVEENPFCNFHTKEIVVGICALCLNQKLLLLAAKQATQNSSSSSSSSSFSSSSNQRFHGGFSTKKKTSINNYFPKIFAFTSLLNRLEFRHSKSDDNYSDHRNCDDDHDASTPCSQEESFISIKFENNGDGSWEKGRVSKVSIDHSSMSLKNHIQPIKVEEDTNKSIIEHSKPRVFSLRWRKRIGHLFHFVKLRRSSNVCHVGTKVEGIKVGKSWIRTLTKRKIKEKST